MMTVSADRPQYLEQTLASWSQVRSTEGWTFGFAVEPGKHHRHVLSMIYAWLSAHQPDGFVLQNQHRLGVLRNPHMILDYAFGDYEYVVLTEEDVVVSNDILEFFAHTGEKFASDVDKTLGICATEWSGAPPDLPHDTCYPVQNFSPLAWATWRDRWENILRDTWDLDYTSGPNPPNQSGWDWNIGRILNARDMYFMFPAVSRSLHIGKHGVHITPEYFEASKAFSFLPHHSVNHWESL